jgi:hypothetical protein
VGALGSFTSLEVELSRSGERDSGECAAVASLLRELPPGQATVRGLTIEQSQVLLRRLGDPSITAAA